MFLETWTKLLVGLVAVLIVFGATSAANAQVDRLYYQEIEKDGRVYVFNTPERYRLWQQSHDMGTAITLIGEGVNGMTIVAENETVVDLYLFKHGLPGYDRPTPKPAPPTVPTALKIGEGELKIGALLQAWYVADDSPVGALAGSGGNWLGNTNGSNTFRIRRAELKLYGKIAADWGFEVMVDPAKTQTFSTSGVVLTDSKILQDLAVTYLGVAHHEFAMGQKKIVVTEEGVHSSSDLDFSERARITRQLSDKRELGLFYKGEFGKKFGLWASFTNATLANTNDDSNDTLFSAVRLDFKPVPGLIVGLSGGTSAGETVTDSTGTTVARRKARERVGGHVRYDGPESVPLGFRFEYLAADDGQLTGPDKHRDGYYTSLLYTLHKQFRFATRFERFDQNDDAPGDTLSQWTVGFHYLPKGKNLNFKLDYYDINEPGRTIAGLPEEDYKQLVLAAQVAF